MRTECLKLHIFGLTGPLILILGQRFPASLRQAILETLATLLLRCGVQLKAFLHQLQPTFVKCLADVDPTVRRSAAKALGRLVPLGAKIDPLLTELLAGQAAAQVAGNGEQQTAYVRAAARSLRFSAAQPDAASLERVMRAVEPLLASDDQAVRLEGAVLCGNYAARCTPEDCSALLRGSLMPPSAPMALRCGTAEALRCVLRDGFANVRTAGLEAVVAQYVVDALLPCEVLQVRAAGAWAAAHFLRQTTVDGLTTTLLGALLKRLGVDTMIDSKLSLLLALKSYVKCDTPQCMAAVRTHLAAIMAAVLVVARDRSHLPLRLAAERVLHYALRLRGEPERMPDYLAGVIAAQRKDVSDFIKRVLYPLADEPDSDGEDDSEGNSL